MLETATEQEKPKDKWEQLGESIGKGLVALLKPQLSKIAKQQIAKFVETGTLKEERKKTESSEPDFSLSDIWNKAGGEKAGFQGIEYIKKEGKIAYVGLKFFQKKYNTDLILDLKMRDRGGYWQIAELSNFADYIKRMDELETKRINELNAPIIETMEKTLVIEEIQKRNKTDDWGIDKKVIFSVQVKNNGEKEIDISYTTDGCMTSHAAGSAATVMAKGKPVRKRIRINQSSILEHLGGMPPKIRNTAPCWRPTHFTKPCVITL